MKGGERQEKKLRDIIDMMKDKSGEDFYKTHQLTDNHIYQADW